MSITFFRWAPCLGLCCAMSVSLPACSSDDMDDVQRHSGDGAGDGDGDKSDGDNGDGDNGEYFSLQEYYRSLCDYYARCSPVIRSFYGDKEQCTQYVLGLLEGLGTEVEWGLENLKWDTDCLQNGLRSVECPSTPFLDREAIEAYQNAVSVAVACVQTDVIGCTEDDNCLTGQCSKQDGECGVCEPLPQGDCRTSYDCATTETCLGGHCGPPQPTGATCEQSNECASGRCRGFICVETRPEGAGCEVTADCGGYTSCSHGKCVAPIKPGAACDATLPLRCQLGHACHEGTCQAVGYKNVPVGGLCASSASCIPGATCSTDSTCEATEQECATESHCSDGQYCDQLCLPKLELGSPCERDEVCQSGFCSDDDVCAERETCE
jgi:hypothetical protein